MTDYEDPVCGSCLCHWTCFVFCTEQAGPLTVREVRSEELLKPALLCHKDTLCKYIIQFNTFFPSMEAMNCLYGMVTYSNTMISTNQRSEPNLDQWEWSILVDIERERGLFVWSLLTWWYLCVSPPRIFINILLLVTIKTNVVWPQHWPSTVVCSPVTAYRHLSNIIFCQT